MYKKKFLFLHPIPTQTGYVFSKLARKHLHIGLAIMAQMILEAKHSVKILQYEKVSQLKIQLIISKLLLRQYDYIFISTFQNQFDIIRDTISYIRKSLPNTIIVIGGVNATVDPERYRDVEYDYLVRGEGENFLKELLYENQFPVMKGVFKKGNEITDSFVPVVSNLDELPFPHRYMGLFKIPNRLTILAQRGCRYSCPYCVNSTLLRFYGKKHLRQRSPSNVIKEIKNAQGHYSWVSFLDENFLCVKDWLDELLMRYKKEVKLPFCIKIRAKDVDELLMKKLVDAGCCRIQIGIEHGDYMVRKNKLNRNETDDEIIHVFDLCHKYKLETYSYNIIGYPFDTEDYIRSLINLNRRCRPTHIHYSLFQPYSGTDLAKICNDQGLIYPQSDSYYRWDKIDVELYPKLNGISQEKLAYFCTNFIKLVRK